MNQRRQAVRQKGAIAFEIWCCFATIALEESPLALQAKRYIELYQQVLGN